MIDEELEGSNDVINSFTVAKEEKSRRHDSLTYYTMSHVILTYAFFDTQYSLSCLDRCDTAGVPVPPSRRSDPDISKFNPVLG